MSKSIFYRSPFLYKLGLKFIHKENYSQRYKILAGFIDEGDSVLEPGCGPAILADYLPANCSYSGFDLNESFIRYARGKSLSVYHGNVLEPESYCPTDIVVCVDILHHLPPTERGEVIDNCWRVTKKKLIICEPYREGREKKWWFEYIEKDGINNPKLEEIWDKEELQKQMEEGFGKIPNLYSRKISKLGKDFIAVYLKK